jgi:hypothetical protein
LDCQIVEYVLLTPAKKISEDQQGRQQLRGHQQRQQCQQRKGTPVKAERQAIAVAQRNRDTNSRTLAGKSDETGKVGTLATAGIPLTAKKPAKARMPGIAVTTAKVHQQQ